MKPAIFSTAVLSVRGPSLIRLLQTSSGSEARTTLVYYCRNASNSQMLAFFRSCFIKVFNTPIYHWDGHSFKTMSCSSLKCADTNKTGHERFSFFYEHLTLEEEEEGGAERNGKGTAPLPQINRLKHTNTHTHSSPLPQIRLSEVEVYTEHLGEVKG